MKLLICPDSFKGCFTSLEGSKIIKNVFKKYFPESTPILFPLADGGEGSIEVLNKLIKGKFVFTESSDPLGRKIKTKYLKKGKSGYIELAKEAGLTFLKEEERNPLETTTYGVGEVILRAIEDGCEDISIFVGGSATNDAGIGALSAIGVKFFDEKGKTIFPGKGKDLIKIRGIDISSVDKKIFDVKFTILTDVKNPLYGKNGASYIYAWQKGANSKEVKILDDGLRNFAYILKKFKGKDISKVKGVGAAGGFPSGFISIFNSKIESGIEFIFKKGNFKEKIKNCDLVITGEGKFDKQSFFGKVVGVIIEYCKKYKVPVIILAGTVERNIYKKINEENIIVMSILPGLLSYDEAMKEGKKLLKIKAQQIFKLLKFRQKQTFKR